MLPWINYTLFSLWGQPVLAIDLLMPLFYRNILAIDDCLLCFLCVFFDIHNINPFQLCVFTCISGFRPSLKSL